MSLASTPQPTTATESEPPRAKPPAPWVWMVVSCLLLGGSVAVRLWQEWRYDAAFENAKTPPFSMRELPLRVGDWNCTKGEETLDKDTLTIAGSSDYMVREYVNEKTGVTLKVMAVFGPAERVFGHSPVVCFPAVGYDLAAAAVPRMINLSAAADPPQARFDALVYSKSNGSSEELIETFYSFWHNGRWDPQASSTKKQFRHKPQMFKVQVQRLVTPTENRATESNPTVDFLKQFMPELQKEIEATTANPEATLTKATS